MDKVTVNWKEYKKWYLGLSKSYPWLMDGRNKVTLTGEKVTADGEELLKVRCGGIGGVIPKRFITITGSNQS